MKYDRIVLGYHGCSRARAQSLVDGTEPFRKSVNDYDWLGEGVYFWEFGLDRAWRWAQEKVAKTGEEPAVVGALIQLGGCFDLLDTRFTRDLGEFHPLWLAKLTDSGAKIPINAGRAPDIKLRRLDCALLNDYLTLQEVTGNTKFQTVRGGFVEGGPAFPGSMIQQETHIQIAVRDLSCIVGAFRPH